MKKYSPEEVTHALQASWSKETGYAENEWTAENPARGHCVVSALIMQDYLGGELIRYRVQGPDGLDEKHYCNVLDDGTIIDSTRSQYDNYNVVIKPSAPKLKNFPTIREKFMADDETRHRYELLAHKVEMTLQQ